MRNDDSVLIKMSRVYFETWLRRTRRRLHASGGIAQTSVVLAAELGGSTASWEQTLRRMLEGEHVPSLDLLAAIDRILAGSGGGDAPPAVPQDDLFGG